MKKKEINLEVRNILIRTSYFIYNQSLNEIGMMFNLSKTAVHKVLVGSSKK